MYSTICFCRILAKLEYSRQILEKFPNIKFNNKNRPVGAEMFQTDGRTDRHEEATAVFRNFAYSPKKNELRRMRREVVVD